VSEKHIQLARMVQGFGRAALNSTKVLRHSKQGTRSACGHTFRSGTLKRMIDRYVYVGPPLPSSVEETSVIRMGVTYFNAAELGHL
jgi:hypothetical protein